MNSLTPIIAGVEITTDAEGRFNLNALHRASETGDHKRPSKWLASGPAQELIEELESQSPLAGFGPINTVRGGNTPGTFAHELLAISYAGWISPKFQLEVNRVFLNYRTKASAPAIDLSDPVLLVQLLTEHASKRIEAEKRASDAEAQVEAAKPKAEFFDSFVKADGLYGLQNAARVLGEKPNKFVGWLKQGYLFYQGGSLVPKAYYRDKGVFEVKSVMVEDKARYRTFITPKGLDYLARKLGKGPDLFTVE